jgi:hypothetical protein
MLVHKLMGASGLANPILTYNGLSTLSFGGPSTTFTFTDVPFGNADTSRLVVVYIHATGTATATTIDSATIGGVSATKVVEANSSAQIRSAAIFAALVPTGASGSVSVTYSTSVSITPYLASYSIYDLSSHTATDTAVFNVDLNSQSPSADVTFTRSAGGVFIAGYNAGGVDAGTTHTWTNATEDLDTLNGTSSFTVASGQDTPSGDLTVSVTGTDTLVNRPNLILAAWR